MESLAAGEVDVDLGCNALAAQQQWASQPRLRAAGGDSATVEVAYRFLPMCLHFEPVQYRIEMKEPIDLRVPRPHVGKIGMDDLCGIRRVARHYRRIRWCRDFVSNDLRSVNAVS